MRPVVSIGAWLALCTPLTWALAPPVPGPPAEPETTLEWRAFRSFSSADGLPQNSVLALTQDREGLVYVGTEHGLASYDGREWRTLELPTGERSYAVGALAAASDGALWVGTDAVGAWRVRGIETQRLTLPGASDAINAFWEAPDGRMWIAASEGLFRCADVQCERIEVLNQGGARSLFGEQRDGRDYLWIGSNREGAIELESPQAPMPRRTGVALAREQGLPNNVALSLARFGGDLWIGSGRGLARFDGERLHVYDDKNGFPVAMVFALLPGRDAQGEPVLLATLRPGGVAELRADGRWRLIDSQHGLPSNATHSLLLERYRGALWIGTMKAGVTRVEAHRWALFDERIGLPDRIVLGVGWSTLREELWVGTARGAARWQAGRFEPLLPPTHNAQLVYDVLDLPDGSRWIAHAQGLQRWRGDALELDYRIGESALPAVSADRLALRRAGHDDVELYAATGHGLARWRERDGLVRIADFSAEIDDAVLGLAAVADPSAPDTDVLWLVTGRGLARLGATGWTHPQTACLDQVALADLALEADETLWIATRNGLRRRDPDGRCVAYPDTRALGALTHVRLRGEDVFVFGARGAMRLRRDAAADQAGRRYGPDSGLVSPEIVASAIDDHGRLFGATAAGLAALSDQMPIATRAPAPLRLVAAEYGATRRPLQAGDLLPSNDSAVRFDYRLLSFERETQTRYRTRLLGLDESFGAWSADASVAYPHLPPGEYRLQVQARDADGQDQALPDFAFSVAAPWWQRAWALTAGALLLLAFGLALGRWRSRAIRRRALALEAEIATRTQELASANAQLEQAAVTDPLTGLKNRRFFALTADAEAERARRAPATQSLLVALVDVDHFKRINDTHGHAAGDRVLVEVAQRLQGLARAGDIVLRWGGEEFLLLLRDVERDAAGHVLQRLLRELGVEPVAIDTQPVAISVSIGAIPFPPGMTLPVEPTLEQAIVLADAALYRAKREGRDRAMLIDPAGIGEPPCWELPHERESDASRSPD